jgi:trk system potassium uptake protein TrkA
MKIAVIGLGQFGRALALRLARSGADVIAVDRDMEVVQELRDDVALAAKLDATDERSLRSQGIDQVDVLVAAIGGDFEANQLVVVQAKRLGIKRVVARAESAVHKRILELIGADEVVMPEEEAAERVSQLVMRPSLQSYFELVDGYSIVEAELPTAWAGKTIADLNLRHRYGVNLIAIKRVVDERESINAVPMPSDAFQVGDVLAIAGSDESLKRLVDEFEASRAKSKGA